MRLTLVLLFILSLALASFVGATGFFLARSATGLLQVGAIASSISQAMPPKDPLALGYRGNPMLALSLPFQIVALQTPLGPAEAWLVPADGAEKGRAIFVHGIAGAREDGYRHLSMLHQAGWSVLLITYRNDPRAPAGPEGKYGFGLLEWPDLEAAVTWFSPGPDGPGLLVVADGMGAAILGQFLAQGPLATRVQAVALDSPALSFHAGIAQLAAQGGHLLPGPAVWVASLLAPRLSGLPLDQAEVSATFAAFPGPLFIAHGAGDQIVPMASAQALAAERPDAITLWTGADHLGSYAADPTAYHTAFAAFLELMPN